jgi:hypothetical protein
LKVRTIVMIAMSLVMSSLMAGKARADEENQAIKVHFSQPVQIPGQVLPAGSYWFELANTHDRGTVQILSEDRLKSYGFLLTINRERPGSESGTAFTIAERGASEPAAVIAWFYPGRTTGHEFVYPKQVEKELALAKHDTQVTGD